MENYDTCCSAFAYTYIYAIMHCWAVHHLCEVCLSTVPSLWEHCSVFLQTSVPWVTTQLDSKLCGAMWVKQHKTQLSTGGYNAVLANSRCMRLLLGWCKLCSKLFSVSRKVHAKMTRHDMAQSVHNAAA